MHISGVNYHKSTVEAILLAYSSKSLVQSWFWVNAISWAIRDEQFKGTLIIRDSNKLEGFTNFIIRIRLMWWDSGMATIFLELELYIV